jgi:hypothetical protein
VTTAQATGMDNRTKTTDRLLAFSMTPQITLRELRDAGARSLGRHSDLREATWKIKGTALRAYGGQQNCEICISKHKPHGSSGPELASLEPSHTERLLTVEVDKHRPLRGFDSR